MKDQRADDRRQTADSRQQQGQVLDGRHQRTDVKIVSKLSDVDGEQFEEVGKMLGMMMREPEKWCGRFSRD